MTTRNVAANDTASSAASVTATTTSASSSSSLCTVALLSFHRELLKQLCAIEKTLQEQWWTLLDTHTRILSSLQNSVPRWQKIVAATLQQQEQQRQQQSHLTATAIDSSFSLPPINVGVLSHLPIVLEQLSVKQSRQIEVAWKLLCSNHADINAAAAAVSAQIETLQEAFAVQKRAFTVAQLNAWIAPSLLPPAAATAGSGHKKQPSAKGKGGSGSNSGSESVSVGNSALNLLRSAEAIQHSLQLQYDAHADAWQEIMRVLRTAAENAASENEHGDIYRLKRTTEEARNDNGADATLPLFEAWLHVSPSVIFEVWQRADEIIQQQRRYVEQISLCARVRPPSQLVEKELWREEKEEE